MEKIVEEVCVTEHFDVHQDWENPIPGFFILASKDISKQSITDFSEDESLELIHLLRRVRNAMRTALGIESIQIYQSEKTEHGFHIWIFPRHPWMEQFGQKVQSIRQIMEFAKETMMTEPVLAEVREAALKVKAALEQK
jgi:diadenosine tetraphosphate (Ap4A) HIT family hydrolase